MSKSRAADVAAICAILLAGALSATWAFIVPIFQATDEAAHFDYAMQIFSTGHLLSLRDRDPAWIVTPYTRYLLGATDYFRVAFHSSMRAPEGYGTVAYYRQLDANGPSLKDALDEPGKINFIAASYPFGFYALEALWIKLVSLVTGSLSAAFFAARLLCVFLTMLGLYFNYRSAVNIGVPPWPSVALVVATGFFPLTTLVSSYVQPDNLGFALVSAAIFFATQLRFSKRPTVTTAALGLSLGFLAVTKYHFFLCTAIPTGLLAIARFWPERLRPAASAGRVLLLTLPSIALLAVQFTLAAPSYARPRGDAQSASLLGSFYDAMQHGIPATIGYLAGNSVHAFVDYFVSGPNAATYWGALGLWDVPLIVVNERVELALRLLISIASALVAVLIAYRIARNLSRFGTMARRGRGYRAVQIAVSDPILNGYALFTLFMVSLYAVTDNVFAAVGRHWYPYVFAAFLCAAWYVPRTFPRFRRAAATLSIAFAAYSLVASGYATAGVLHRYYDAPDGAFASLLPRPSQIALGSALGVLWPIQGMDFHPLSARRFRTTFTPGSQLWAGGSAIFPRQGRAAEHVAVVIDDRFAVPTLAGQYNFQIAEATRSFAYGYSGFYAPFGTRGLAEGAHFVTAYARVPDSASYQEIAPRRLFFIAPRTAFSEAFRRRLSTSPPARGRLDAPRLCRSNAGDVIMATGRLGDGAPTGAASTVWLLVDEKPYAASYGNDGHSFFAAIPAADLDAGKHLISAYVAIPRTSAYLRIPRPEAFTVATLPAECRHV